MTTIVPFAKEKRSFSARSLKGHNEAAQLYLPLFPEDFRGVVWIIHFEAVSTDLLDKLYRRYYLSAIIDFRVFPLLGKSERAHRKICEYIDKMHVRYLRLNELVSHFDEKIVFNFNKRALFLNYLEQRAEVTEHVKNCINCGSVALVTSKDEKENEEYLRFIYDSCGTLVRKQAHYFFIG